MNQRVPDRNREPEEAHDETAAPQVTPRSKTEGGWVQSIAIALLLALFIRHFLFQAYKIPSGSMIPTLLVGDQLIANKISYGIRMPFASEKLVKFATPAHGEVVVFRFPDDPSKDFIKRVIGRPGDRVRIEDGEIFVNGEVLPREPGDRYRHEVGPGDHVSGRVYHETHGTHTYTVLYDGTGHHPFWNMPEVALGPDEVFVMGDNRDRSNDSRFWGPVDLDLLEGRPMFIHFSWDAVDPGVRWSRLGTGLN